MTDIKKYTLMIAVAWAISVLAVMLLNINDHKAQTLEIARNHARASFEKDLVYRHWAAGHGGVYVPVTKDTPPNEYLSHLKERDIVTPSNRKLTLINPAYMTRQVHELGAEKYGLRGHITSLNPIRPENAPDPWEQKILKIFETDPVEVIALENIDGRPHMRLMKPMITEKGCMKCHASQGYQIGDIRGGISVSVPMEPLLAIANADNGKVLLGYLSLCVLGLIGIVLTGQNISNRIKQDNQSQEEHQLQLRELQLQMVQHEKMVSIGQLAAGVAHEMNTPVGFVASNFQTLQDYLTKIQKMLIMHENLIDKVDACQNTELLKLTEQINTKHEELQIGFILEDIQDLFKESGEGLERVTSIIQNLRDFSRIDQTTENSEYDLNNGIESTLAVARNEIKYDCDIKTDFSEIPLVQCNSGQINQVFLNIFVNAAQAIRSHEREEKGNIVIRTYTQDEKVVCEISDDGPGIPAEVISSIFNPFFTTKPVGKGTGLGLSVSYDIIVNKHKGALNVDSIVGSGTKFTIELPIEREISDNDMKITENEKQDSTICG